MKRNGTDTDGITEPDREIIKHDDMEYRDMIGHLRGDEEFNGPIEKRKCTNIRFLILFIICNCGLIACTVYIFLNGDPNRLTKGYDLRGNNCGLNDLVDKRFMLFPNQSTLD